MEGPNPHSDEFRANHEEPMTFQRVFFRAQQSARGMLEFVQNAFDTRLEGVRLAPRPVVHHAILPVGVLIIGTPSQLLAQEEIPNACVLDHFVKARLAELWEPAAARLAAHVNEEVNRLILEKLDELQEIQVRVAHCEKWR